MTTFSSCVFRGVVVFCLVFTGISQAQTFAVNSDVQPTVVNSRITTNAHAHDGTSLSNVRVFSYSFQEDPFDPFYLNDPGFNSFVGSGLPQGSQLNFKVLSGLRYWNGSGAVGFGDTPYTEQLRMNRGTTSVIVNNSTTSQNGFAIANIASGGTMHAHLNTFLERTDVAPTNGIYLVAIDVGNTGAGIARSLPTYLVFNNSALPASFNRARAYVTQPLTGDANFDGAVDTRDFNLLAANFGQTGQNWLGGDFNEDGVVNSIDFSLFLGGYGQHTVVPLGAVVPEPSAAVLLIPGSCLLRRARRINS